MQYADLSPDQKNALAELDKIIRTLGRTFAKAARDAALIAESHQLNTASVLDDLDVVAASFGGEDKTLVYIKAAGVNAILE